MIVYVDLFELLMYFFLTFAVTAVVTLFLGLALTPSPARRIIFGKWLHRGKRNFIAITNEDNVLDIVLGRPRNYGIKLSKRRMLVPRGEMSDLVSKRATLSGTGLPIYLAETRAGIAYSPDFARLLMDLTKNNVIIQTKIIEAQKPVKCQNPRCRKTIGQWLEQDKISLKPNDDKFYEEFRTFHVDEDAKDSEKEVAYWECKLCETKVEPVKLLNPHIVDQIGRDSYDPTLMEGIELDAKQEALTERPTWFVWFMVALIPHALIALATILSTQG